MAPPRRLMAVARKRCLRPTRKRGLHNHHKRRQAWSTSRAAVQCGAPGYLPTYQGTLLV